MNYGMINYILGWVMTVESAFMILPCVTAVIYGEKQGFAFLIVAVITAVIGTLLIRKKPEKQEYHTREGFLIVSLSWVVISIIGALPFVINKDIPSFTDALFETISGFTTTGASILTDIESLSHCSLFWRSFTHWLGGMGVIVFLLVVLPSARGQNMYLMKAESPGPSVDKLVPHVRETARILYGIYLVITLAEIVFLLVAGMPMFDALTTAFGTAGTGGFAIKADSIAGYSVLIQVIVTVFMLMFGINFSAYYLILKKQPKKAFGLEEVRWYLGIVLAAILIIAFNTRHMFDGALQAIQQAAFQVASIITTTGFATTDFNLWPQLSRGLLVAIMFIGACAGSTGGGIKVSRIVILFKAARREIRRYLYPRSVENVSLDDRPVANGNVSGILAFFAIYIIIFTISVILITFNNFDLETSFTSVAATINNIGPGLSLVGPTGNYSMFTWFSKYILMFDMLAGRLELYPMLLLFVPASWKRY